MTRPMTPATASAATRAPRWPRTRAPARTAASCCCSTTTPWPSCLRPRPRGSSSGARRPSLGCLFFPGASPPLPSLCSNKNKHGDHLSARWLSFPRRLHAPGDAGRPPKLDRLLDARPWNKRLAKERSAIRKMVTNMCGPGRRTSLRLCRLSRSWSRILSGSFRGPGPVVVFSSLPSGSAAAGRPRRVSLFCPTFPPLTISLSPQCPRTIPPTREKRQLRPLLPPPPDLPPPLPAPGPLVRPPGRLLRRGLLATLRAHALPGRGHL